MKLYKAVLLLFALVATVNGFSQCSICSTPAAPAEYGGTFTASQYKGTALQLWALPQTNICERDWYKVVGTDTTSLGTGDTLSVTTDTTCQYIARNKNTCSGSPAYYSSYAVMGNITIVAGITAPTYTIGYSPVICSGTPTDIYLYTPTGTGFQYLIGDSQNVSSTVNGSSYNGPMSVTLTNKTSTNQTVRILIRMYKSSPPVYADSRILYVTVLPSTAPTGNHCFAPSTPNPFFSSVDTRSYAKGSLIQLMADTTVTADTVQWYKVVGTDTSYAGAGYTVNVTTDTTCQYIARNENACNCSSASVYFSSWTKMANYTVSTTLTPTNFRLGNYMTTIASGTQIDIVPDIDSGAFNTFAFYRDNAYVSGSTSAASGNLSVFGVTLTNTTTSPQLVRFRFLSQATTSGSPYGSSISGYVTVLPSTSTAPAGNHCTLPTMANNTYQNVFGAPQNFCYVKGATVNLDLNHGISSNLFSNSLASVDSVDWYKVRWPGDTTYIGNSYPINALMDTSCTIFSISKNVCYWSDSSKHIYSSGKSRVLNATALSGTNPTVSFTNNALYLCNGKATNIQVSSASGNVVVWLRDNTPKVTGKLTSNMYYYFPATIVDTLTDTIAIPQQVNFEAESYTTISGKTCWGTSALTSVTTYPSCTKWNNTIKVSPTPDSICSGATATLTADTLPCSGGTRYVWSSGDTTRSISKTAAGTYTVTATNTCGCSATASATVTVNANPSPMVNNVTICAGATATLTATGGTSYVWNTSATTASITTSTAGTYTVTATNTFGCTATASGIVTVHPNPVVNAGNDTSICYGSSLVLGYGSVASGGTTPYIFAWSPSQGLNDSTLAHPTATIDSAIAYILAVVDSNGCSGHDTINISRISLPLPPYAPIILSACSDSATNIAFDYVSTLGESIRWSMDSNFTSPTIEYPVTGSYLIQPFNVAIPGDTTETVWMRSINIVTGCVSSIVSTIVQTDALPLQKSIYAIDTIVPQDSTTSIVVPNSQSGILYTLQIGSSTASSATGTGDTLYIPTPPIDSTTIIDVYGISTYSSCNKKENSLVLSSAASSEPIYVTVSHSTPVQTCKPDSLFITVKNNTTGPPIDTIKLNLVVNTPYFSCIDSAFNCYLGSTAHPFPPVKVIDSLYQIILISTPAGSTWTFLMKLIPKCAVIPDSVPSSNGSVNLKNDSTNKIYVWVSAPDAVGINNTSGVTSANPFHLLFDSIQYPTFDRDLSPSTAFNAPLYFTTTSQPGYYTGCASQGDIITRKSYFYNKGSAAFNGGINIKDNLSCGGMTLLNATMFLGSYSHNLSSVELDSLLGSGYIYNLATHAKTVSIDSDIVLEETLVVNSCLSNSCLSVVQMIWGCDTTTLCKTNIPSPYYYSTTNCRTPLLRISRILPVSNMQLPGGDSYWDSSCTNKFTKWEFEVQNDTSSTASLSNVHVVLNKNDMGSYSFINKDTSFHMGYARAPYGGGLPLTDSLSYTLIPLADSSFIHAGRFIPACLHNSNVDSPFSQIDIRINTLKRGDKFFFSFYTYQCCPSDTQLFNNDFSMNHWTINAYGNYCAGSGTGLAYANAYAAPTATPAYYNPYPGRNIATSISPYYYDGRKDFGISQSFVPPVYTMSVPQTVPCKVQNLLLNTDNDFRSYQLLFQNGYINGADTPTFRLVVDFDTDTGLYVPHPDSVYISGLGYNWYGITLAHDSFHTEIAFDIHTLGYLDTAILGVNGAAAFKAFFEGSIINFSFSSYCNAVQPQVAYKISTYLKPRATLNCDNCKIPLARESNFMFVLCPGCRTPGVFIHNAFIRRTNFGFPDTLDNGLATRLTPISPVTDSNYFSRINVGAAIVGDTIRSFVTENFVDGDPTTGVSYQAWQQFWRAHGDSSSAYFSDLFLEQGIPYSDTNHLYLTAIKDTLYYSPATDSAGQAPRIIPIPVTPSNVAHIGDYFLYRVGIDQIRSALNDSTIAFEPNDEYRLSSYYTVCGNIDLDSLDYVVPVSNNAYFTTPLNSAMSLHAASTDSVAGDYFITHKNSTVNNDSVLLTNALIYYKCTGFPCPFSFYHVNYDVSGPNNFSDHDSTANDTRCRKNLQMGLIAEIQGPMSKRIPNYFNDFPYEVRPIPGLTTGTHININGNDSTYAYLIKSIGQCYQVKPENTQTTIILHPNMSIQQGYTQTMASGFDTSSVGPYERFTFPPVFAYATAQNYDSNSHLLLGDEYFQQIIEFQLTAPPACVTGCPDTMRFNTNGTEKTIVPPISACAQPSTLIPLDSVVFIRPHALDTVVTVSVPYSGDVNSFTITQIIKISRDNPDYLYVYIDTLSIPSGLSIDKVTPYVQSLNGMDTPIHVGPYLLFDLGFGPYHYGNGETYLQYDTLTYYFHWKNCPPSLTRTINTGLPFYINWQCDSFPTVLPDSSCHVPVLDSLPLEIDPASFGNYTVNRMDTFSSCDTLHFTATIKSGGSGDIYNIADSLSIDSGLVVVPGSIKITYLIPNNPSGLNTITRRDTTVQTSLINHSVPIPSTIIMSSKDSLTLSFSVIPNCHYNGIAPVDTFYGISFCGNSVNKLVVRFDSLSLTSVNQCGPFFRDSIIPAHCPGDSSASIIIWIDSIHGPHSRDSVIISPNLGIIKRAASGLSDTITHLPVGVDTISVINLASGCVQTKIVTVGPLPITLSNVSITNPVCASIHNGSISVTVSGGTSPDTCHWSTGATTRTISGLIAGIYTVTVTDHNGCTAIFKDTLVNQFATCCFSTDTPAIVAAALTFGAGTSTAFLQQIKHPTQLSGYVSGDTLNSLNKSVYINGLITLDTDLYLINCPNLLFGVNGGILVTNGHHLYIQGSALYAAPCGGNMWLGIENTGTGSTVYTSSSGGNAPMIRDARKAIYTHGGASDSILDCKFYNNWDGIYLDGTAGIPQFSVSGCTFSTSAAYGGLKSDTADNPSSLSHSSDVGIYVKSPSGGTANATIGSMTGKRNYFFRLNCGIYCSHNSMEVVHCTFDSINIPPTNMSYYHTQYLGRAIYVTDSTVGYALKVGDWKPAGADTIGVCYRGIDEIGTTGSVRIVGNRITHATNTGIYMGPDQISYAINDSIEIAHNTIDAIGTKSIIPTGICMSACGWMVYIHGNTIRLIDTTYAIYQGVTTLDTAAIGIVGINSGLKNQLIMDSNNISHVQQGIYLSNWSIAYARENYIGICPLKWHSPNRYWAGVSATQSMIMRISNNLIDGNSDSIQGPGTYGANGYLSGKEIGIYTQAPRSWCNINCNGIQNTDWSIATSVLTANHQILQNNRFFKSRTGVSIFNHGFIGPQGNATISNDNEWDTTTMIKSFGAYVADGRPDSFYLRNPSHTIYNPNLAQIFIPLSYKFSIDTITSVNTIATCPLPTPTFSRRAFMDILPYLESIALDSVQFVSDTIDNLKWSRESLIDQIQQYPDVIDSSEIISNFYKASMSLSYVKLMQVFYGMQSDTNTVNLTSYKSTNSGVSPVDVNEQNLQAVNNLYLTYFMSMPDSFYQTGNLMSGIELTNLYNVASQCYLPGGPAVFLARSMYWSAIRDNGMQFWDDCVSPIGGDKKANANKPNSSVLDSVYRFKVYPNPMDKQNSLNIQCSESGDISFYNMLGQIAFKSHLVIGINTFSCAQLSCETSVILYKAKMQSGKTETGKIVTMK